MRHPKEMEALARRIEHDIGLLDVKRTPFPAETALHASMVGARERMEAWLPVLRDLLNGDDSAVLRLTRKQLETL